MKKVVIRESDLRKMVAESVKKALNELRSTTISNASKKFRDKYTGDDGWWRKDLEHDEYGNPLHPKDKKPLAQHMRNFSRAYNQSAYDEQFEDPTTKEAMDIWEENESEVDWDVTDSYEHGYCAVTGYLEIDGWEFTAVGEGHYAGGLEIDDIDYVEFKSPDGQEGSFNTHPAW